MSKKLLEVIDLETSFLTEEGELNVLDKVSFSIHEGETVGIVGESGCGKSVTSLSVMRLLPRPAGNIKGGKIVFEGEDLLKKTVEDMFQIRGRNISMIFQEPMTALNPVQKIGKQIGEVFELHHPEMSRDEIQKKSLKLLEDVGIPDPFMRLSEYPHELSGGIRQRVMIAQALALKPKLLIADEPTTALDVTIQAQILDLMKRLQKDMGMAIMFITHDLGVIAELSDTVVVMYAGRVVEKASAVDLFKNPLHPYTKGLLSSIPRLETKPKTTLPIIEGMVPPISEFKQGCRFHNRCPYAEDHCLDARPVLEEISDGHFVACIRKDEIK